MPEVDYGLHGHEYIRKFVALEGQACVFLRLCILVEPGFLHLQAGNQGEFAVNKKLEPAWRTFQNQEGHTLQSGGLEAMPTSALFHYLSYPMPVKLYFHSSVKRILHLCV